jgi:hypothetical protein
MHRLWDAVTLVVLVALVLGGPAAYVGYRNGQPLGESSGDVVGVVLFDPAGPPERAFTRTPQPFSQPIDPLVGSIPGSLPHPVWQGLRCGGGLRLLVTFTDGASATYGPCRYPRAILPLYAAALSAETAGACEPSCGPGGTNVPGPRPS